MGILAKAGDLAWNPAIILIFLSAGLYCSVHIRFFQLRPRLWIRELLHAERSASGGSIAPWKAAVTAIGGALGTGNIAGVAWAVALGGPGAVFWMWMSALFGMALSFTEKTLTLMTVRREKGGPLGGAMCYIENALGKAPAVIYALLSAASFASVGSMTQCSALTGSICALTGSSEVIVGIALALMTYLIISGGLRRTAAASSVLVPAVSVAYVACGFFAIYILRSALPDVMRSIFLEAFNFRPAASGTGAVLAMRYGYARGVFSSEAGVGSSTIPHASSSAQEPAHQGVWGIFEVFLDTIVICTITALIILCGPYSRSGLTGEVLTSAAFSVLLGKYAGPFTAFCILVLAFSTIISREWCFEQSLRYLLGDRLKTGVVRKMFCVFSFLGAVLPSRSLWDSADILNIALAVPNLAAVCVLARVAAKRLEHLRSFGSLRKRGAERAR